MDDAIRARFGDAHHLAATGLLEAWRATPRGALAYILLLDQFSRNLHRGDARAFRFDPAAREAARCALSRRFDMTMSARARAFIYMPFMHAEDLADQDLSVRLFMCRLSGQWDVKHALQHRDVIRRYGRFPHRNAALGRVTTAAEHAFLKAGGFAG